MRIAIVIALMVIVLGGYWVALPIVRAAMLPVADRAHGLLWVVGPATALRFGAATVLSAVTLPFVLLPFRERWRASPTPMPSNHVSLLIRGALFSVVYAIACAFYFTAYIEVRDSEMAFHGPLGTRRHRYDQIVALEHQPPVGGQPYRYAIHFDDDSWGYFDEDHEGVDASTVSAIADHVSRRVGRPWFEGGTR
jgi:hypothetical protein